MNSFRNVTPIHYRPKSLAELGMMKFPEVAWLVDPILPSGSFTLFSGREKSGKSLLVADLAACVSGGERFLDHEVTAGPVIIVPAEENLREVWQRFQRRLCGDTDRPLFVLPVNRGDDDCLDLALPACFDALRAMVAEIEPVLLILDPFRELHGEPENDADAMGPLLRPLRQLAHDTNVSVVLTHHMSRSGSFRGSTAIRAAADQEWAYRRTDESDVTSTVLGGVLTIEGRYGARQNLGIRLEEDLRWSCTDQAIKRTIPARIQTLGLLRDVEEPVTAQEIAHAIGVTLKTVQNVLSEVQQSGTVTLQRYGKGTKCDPHRYFMGEREAA